jgi:cell division control protein 6
LLRVSTEKAEQSGCEAVEVQHVRMAQNQIECDQITPIIKTLPPQQKLVLYSVLLNEKNGLSNIATGEVYEIYRQACKHYGTNNLTQRRITDLLSNLDMLGLITSKTVSRGRYGRSKQINSCMPISIDATSLMIASDEALSAVDSGSYRFQTRL